MSETLEEFAILFSDIMNEYAIVGSLDADQALDKLYLFWSERILPLMPFQSLSTKAREE